MKTVKGLKSILLATAACVGVVSTNAVSISPSSYDFSRSPQNGNLSYADGGSDLTDGVYGPTRLVSASDAQPYVGWKTTTLPSVSITFDFASPVTFESVTVSALQNFLTSIVIPDVYLYSSSDNGASWDLIDSLITPHSAANNSSKKALSFEGLNLTSDLLKIELSRNSTGPWVLIDEVTFESNSVPEVGSTLALLALGVSGLFAFRPRK